MTLTKRTLYALMPALAFLTFKSKGGGGGGSQTSTTTQVWDEDVKKQWLKMIGVAEDVTDLPFQKYTGDRIAQYDPLQIKGFEAYQNALGTGAGTLNNAINTASQSAGYSPDMVGTRTLGSTFNDYLNPYTQQVIDPALADLQQSYGIQQQQQAGAATAAGAFGGSRHGVQAALGDQAYYDQAGQLSAGLHHQGFNTALGAFMGDSALMQQGDIANQAAGLEGNAQQLGASELLAALSGQERDLAFGDAQVQVDLGAEKQGLAQSELDLAYSDFLEEQNEPLADLEILMAAFGITPQLSGSTTTTTKS
jgi:hypothetical protein